MATQYEVEGLDEVLQGCAACCDGVLRQAQAANLNPDLIRRLGEARDLCRGIANDLQSAGTATSGTTS
ncbi:MAG: hypothetical protein M3P51_00135 [Chloroflexota bacterium]|nr:hypothetical protein [Chloroflexota bacterium]